MDQLGEIERCRPDAVRVVPPGVISPRHPFGLHLSGHERARRIQASAAGSPEPHQELGVFGSLEVRIEAADFVQCRPTNRQVGGAERDGTRRIDDERRVPVILKRQRPQPVIPRQP